jgi:hypothetical protein
MKMLTILSAVMALSFLCISQVEAKPIAITMEGKYVGSSEKFGDSVDFLDIEGNGKSLRIKPNPTEDGKFVFAIDDSYLTDGKYLKITMGCVSRGPGHEPAYAAIHDQQFVITDQPTPIVFAKVGTPETHGDCKH